MLKTFTRARLLLVSVHLLQVIMTLKQIHECSVLALCNFSYHENSIKQLFHKLISFQKPPTGIQICIFNLQFTHVEDIYFFIGKRTNLKDDSSSDEEFQPNQSDGSDDKQKNKRKRKNQKKKSSDEDDASDGSAEGGSSDESDVRILIQNIFCNFSFNQFQDEPKSKKRKAPKANNKVKPKGTPSKRGRPAASAKKTPSRGAKKAKSQSSDEESGHKDDGSSSEDEPLVKKTKSSEPPTVRESYLSTNYTQNQTDQKC